MTATRVPSIGCVTFGERSRPSEDARLGVSALVGDTDVQVSQVPSSNVLWPTVLVLELLGFLRSDKCEADLENVACASWVCFFDL